MGKGRIGGIRGSRAASVRGERARTLLAAVALGVALAGAASAQDSDQPRAYLGMRIGESNPITKANDVASFSVGANVSRHLGFEFSVDGYELFLSTPTRDRVAELGITGLTPQLRLRYPLLGDRLVPYVLAGAGLAVAQINDANEPTEWASGSLTSLRALGVFGGGVEYYISDDIAAGVEGKYMLTGSKTYDAAGSKNEVDMNAGLLTFGLRMFYPELDGGEAKLATARRARRFYVNARFGGALRRAGDVFPGIHTAPEQTLFGSNFSPLYAVGVGIQLSEILDVEVSGSNYELRLGFPGGGSAECSVFPLLVQTKLHVPMRDARVDPYVLLGVGGEILEPNDSGGIALQAGGVPVIGAMGAGLDYFLTSDVALGLEAKYLFSRGHTLQVQGGEPLRGDLDSFFVSLGIRAFLFDF